jgi:predicted DNA-binding transcriptional regulator AlpA
MRRAESRGVGPATVPATPPPGNHADRRAPETARGPAGSAEGRRPPVERMALRIEEVAAALGVSRRAVERERSAGRLPRPDLTIGRMPLWRVETIRSWMERGGR